MKTQANPEETEEQRLLRKRKEACVRAKAWALENPERVKTRSKNYYKLNKIKMNAYNRKYVLAHPQQKKDAANRYARAHTKERDAYYKNKKFTILAQMKSYRYKNKHNITCVTQVRINKYRNAKRCIKCGRKSIDTIHLCAQCWFSGASRNAQLPKYTGLSGKVCQEFVKMLLEKQKYTCPYTGEALIPGVNASLDHIKSKSRFPESMSDLHNLEWTTKVVNYSKNYLSRNEFIAYCCIIRDWSSGVAPNDADLVTVGDARKFKPHKRKNKIYSLTSWVSTKSSTCLIGTKAERRILTKKLMVKITEQAYICPYTGFKLVPGENASLDHILPHSKYPDLRGDINNLHWVDLATNYMKKDMTHDEFLKFCTLIASRKNIETPAATTMYTEDTPTIQGLNVQP